MTTSIKSQSMIFFPCQNPNYISENNLKIPKFRFFSPFFCRLAIRLDPLSRHRPPPSSATPPLPPPPGSLSCTLVPLPLPAPPAKPLTLPRLSNRSRNHKNKYYPPSLLPSTLFPPSSTPPGRRGRGCMGGGGQGKVIRG